MDLRLHDDRAVQLAPFVTLAEAGAQAKTKPFAWVPAFAGMTVWAVPVLAIALTGWDRLDLGRGGFHRRGASLAAGDCTGRRNHLRLASENGVKGLRVKEEGVQGKETLGRRGFAPRPYGSFPCKTPSGKRFLCRAERDTRNSGIPPTYLTTTVSPPTAQIRCEYSLIDRSELNQPLRAQFRIDARVQSSWSPQRRSTSRWARQ